MSQFRKKYKVISNLKAAKLLLRRAAAGFFGRRTLSHSCLIYEPSFSTLLVVFCFVMFSIGERSPESSTIKPYCSNSYRMQFTVACWKMQALPWKRCFREALMHIPVVQAVNSIDTNAPRYHQHCRLLNRYLLASLVWRLWRPCIPKRISNFDSSDDRVVLHIDRDDYKVHIWLLLCITELVFPDNDFWKYSWARAVIFQERIPPVFNAVLPEWRSKASKTDFSYTHFLIIIYSIVHVMRYTKFSQFYNDEHYL